MIMTTTRSSFPINFDLYDADEEQVLFITDDVAGQELTLEITNTSDKPTTPKKLNGEASATVNHFELVFRPGILYNNPAAVKLESSQFAMFMDKDSNGNIIKLEASGVSVTASSKLTITASTIEVSAGMVTVNAGMSKFSGVVQADTIITNAVISASYTPGAGNVW